MKSHWPIAQLTCCFVILCGIIGAQTPIATTEQNFTVSRVGGTSISRRITSLWLAGADRRPLLMVYFHGPDDWHKTLWKMDSKFEKGKPGWAALQSENATLRVEINPETMEVRVQSGKFNINESNTFLVLHMGELLVPHKIISLGVFDLPPSNDKPSSLLLLQAHPELIERINKEARAGDHRIELGDRSPDHSLARPCIERRIGLLNKNASWSVKAVFPAGLAQDKILRSPGKLPCFASVLDEL